MAFSLVTGPSTEPISVDEARLELRIDTNADNAAISRYISAARQEFEAITGVALITQAWKLSLDHWPSAKADQWWDGVRDGAISMFAGPYVEVNKGPVQSITSITTYNQDGAGSIWSSSSYQLDSASRPARIAPVSGQAWPTATRALNAIEIQFVAGYGDLSTDVPFDIRQALLSLVGDLYEHRGDVEGGVAAYAARAFARYRDIRI